MRAAGGEKSGNSEHSGGHGEDIDTILYNIRCRLDSISNLEIDYNSDEIRVIVAESLQSIVDNVYSKEVERLVGSLGSIFPSNVAEINLPNSQHAKVPNVKEWARSKGYDLRTYDVHQSYISKTSDAKNMARELFIGYPNDPVPKVDIDELEITESIEPGNYIEEAVKAIMNRIDESSPADAEALKMARKLLSRLPDPDKNNLINLYIENIIAQNEDILNKLIECAVDVAEANFVHALGVAVHHLGEELGAHSDLGLYRKPAKSKKRSRRNPRGTTSEAGSNSGGEIDRPLDFVRPDRDYLPWLDEQLCDNQFRVLDVTRNGEITVVTLDARSRDMINIENSSFADNNKGRPKERDITPCVLEEIKRRSSELAGASSCIISNVAKVSNTEEKYKRVPIIYRKGHGPNAARVYSIIFNAGNMPEGPMKEDLRRFSSEPRGEVRAHLLVGACSKANQDEALSKMTCESASTARSRGAGSI